MNIFRDINGYEGLYQISDDGRVFSILSNKYLRPGRDKDGYLKVMLCKNCQHKTFFIHRLVAQAFLKNFNNLPQVNHKDENKTNNMVDNLEWCDAKYNSSYGTKNERAITKKIDKGLVNKELVGLTRKEWNKKYYEFNREKILEQKKEYSKRKKQVL